MSEALMGSLRKAIASLPVIGPALGSLYRRVRESRGHAIRYGLAKKYLQGTGLEIGALHRPLPVPPSAKVRYVDRMDAEGLRQHYPELKNWNLVPIDVIDDGESLTTLAPASQDFIIANHFLEHTQNPIGTLERFLQVLKPGGVLYLAIPDKRWTFDVHRDVTPLEHLYRDYREGPAWSYSQHMREWVEKVNGTAGAEVEREIERLTRENYSIHFHVWTQKELVEMLADIRTTLNLPFTLAEVQSNQTLSECVCILTRT